MFKGQKIILIVLGASGGDKVLMELLCPIKAAFNKRRRNGHDAKLLTY